MKHHNATIRSRGRAARSTCSRSVAVALLALAPFTARAQGTDCTYAACSVRIAPVWHALDVVRGGDGGRVASLGFFWVKDVSPALAVNDSAAHYAKRAVGVRRVAAVLTDVGALALGYAAIRRASNGSFTRSDRGVAIAGASVFAASVPLQFVADGLLSQSVWWFNSSVRR